MSLAVHVIQLLLAPFLVPTVAQNGQASLQRVEDIAMNT